LIGTHSAIVEIPAFPGAQYNFATRELLANALQMACSRPPEPITSTLISFFINELRMIYNSGHAELDSAI
jgi:hypothetical protein